jgi:hypothetical protein
MSQSPKTLPRFIPTLTEVVPGSFAAAMPASQDPVDPGPMPGLAVDEVQRRIHFAMQSSLRTLLDETVAAQLADMRPRLVAEIDRVLQEKLSALVAAELTHRGVD